MKMDLCFISMPPLAGKEKKLSSMFLYRLLEEDMVHIGGMSSNLKIWIKGMCSPALRFRPKAHVSLLQRSRLEMDSPTSNQEEIISHKCALHICLCHD